MAFLKGPRIGNVINVATPVKFLSSAQFINANPWGTSWFVDGTDGSDSYDGLSTSGSKATVDAAVQLAGVGDVVYIRPKAYVVGTGMARYTELITVDLAQSNLSIVGVNYPNNNEFGVRLAWTTTAAYVLDCSAPALHLENVHFFSDGATGSLILRNNGATNTQRNDGCTIYGCNFKGGTAGVTIEGGQATRIIDSVFLHSAGTLTIATSSVSGYGQQIRGCSFLSNNGVLPTLQYLNASGAHVYNLWVDGCYFGIIPTAAKFIILGGTLCDGLISNCFFNDADVHVTTDLTLGGTNMRVAGCWDWAGIVV